MLDYKKVYRKILRYNLNQRNRSKLKNTDFSLLSMNCVGGVVLHELGLRFNSPTINLRFTAKDYLKFLKNLNHYLYEVDLVYSKGESLKCGFPVGRLDDISIYFQHYISFEEAKKKWFERVKRINLDNLYIVMVQRDGCTKNEVEEFDKLAFKHKVIFTSKEFPEFQSAFYIPNSEIGDNEVKNLCDYQTKLCGKRILDEFDWIEFFNSL